MRQTANSGRNPHVAQNALRPIAPLHGALVVVDALARGDQVAAGEADQHPIAHLAGEHGGVDLVELLQALGDAPAVTRAKPCSARPTIS